MAGAKSSEKPVFTLKLLVDKKKNKVVLAEAGKDFVDLLFSFLTLPMGTVVRLIEKYQKNHISEATMIGCFNNLYKSVLDTGTANFMTEACKDMLLYPRSVLENVDKRLKLNIDYIEVLKYYRCPKTYASQSCCLYSNFRSSRCCCGQLMTEEYELSQCVTYEEIFVSHKPLFTITDKLKVGFASISHTLKTLKVSGYSDVDQLHEMHVEVDHQKVLALLKCLFSSDTPLSDVFLKKERSCVISKVLNMSSLAVQPNSGGVVQSNKVMSVSVFTRKLDNKVLYIECEKDFVDFLFTFLVLPLNSVWKLAGSNLVLGCIDNLCESFKNLSSIERRNALNGKCVLPWYYRCQQPLLDIGYAERDRHVSINDRHVSINSNSSVLKPLDPRCDKIAGVGVCSGFVKRGTTFMVLDDLTITPIDLSSAFCSLKKWNMDFDDIEEQVINISNAEAIRLLRASLATSNALTTVFESLLQRNRKKRKFKASSVDLLDSSL